MPDMWMDVDAALSEVPVNVFPLIDDTDFKSIEGAVAYNAAGMALRWHFVTTAGAYTVTSVTPTTAGVHDWTDQGDAGIYTIEIPASAGTINNDTEGFGWFTGVATGVLPWRGPTIGFRAAGLNNLLVDTAYSATRGLAGTAVPDAVADAAGGLAISDVGGVDLDAVAADAARLTAVRAAVLTDLIDGGRLDLLIDAILLDTGTTLEARFTGITSLAEWLGLLAGKQAANATALTEIKATGAGSGTYSETTDSQEAIKDLGDSAWATGGGTGLSSLSSGTAQSATATTIVLAAAEVVPNDTYNGCRILITGGTGIGQSRYISDWVLATDTATVSRAWTTNPDATSTYEIQAADSNVEGAKGGAMAAGVAAGEVGADVRSQAAQAVTTAEVDNWQLFQAGDQAAALAAVQTDLDNGTDGLGALKTLIDTVNTDLSNGTDGLGALKTLIDAITTTVGVAGAGLTDLGGMSTGMKAEVNVEAKDVIATDTFAELAADPGATPTPLTALMLIYMMLRNKVDVTASAKELHNNAGTVVLTKTLSDDGTTYSESKMA